MEQAAFAIKVAEKVIGEGNVQQQHRVEMGAEDFAYMLNKRPGAYLFLERARMHSYTVQIMISMIMHRYIAHLSLLEWLKLCSRWFQEL